MRIGLKILFIICINSAIFSQIPIGQWRAHLPYSNGMNVEIAGSDIYCLTQGGLFKYSLADNSTKSITRIDGLSDVVINTIKYIPEKSTLVIGYENGNIDLVENNVIYNIADIYRKPITGNKSINSVNYVEGIVYLSCGFGIVVLDVERKEIKDTYFIGPGGIYMNVFDICADQTFLYAATGEGIYKAQKNDPNLVNYANWSKITSINNSSKHFGNIVFFDSNLFALYKDDANKDTLYKYDGSFWAPFDTSLKTIKNLVVSQNKLIAVEKNYIKTYDPGTMAQTTYNTFFTQPRDGEFSSDGSFWVADNNLGLVWKKSGTGNFEYFHPNGPSKTNAIGVAASGNQVWVVPGGKNPSWGNLWNAGEVYRFKDQQWTNINSAIISELNRAPDICDVTVNPKNANQVFLASYGGGVFELNNGNFVAKYTEDNSTLQNIFPGDLYLRVGGLTMDEDQNLWVTVCGDNANNNVKDLINVRQSNGNWKGFSVKNDMSANLVGKIIAGKDGTKWCILVKGRGLFAFNENGTIDDESDDQKKYVSVVDENGDIITNEIFSIAEDKDGLIWVGTNKGVVFYYNPEEVFTNSNFYAQQIKIPNENPGQANYLLEAESVTAIAVDGSNRKWFGTENGGVLLMSADGTQEILHFTKENSPLLSNAIIAITIDHVSGEVFISTDKGLVSYRSTSTEGQDYFHDVYAFPNPVRPGYEGLIAIKGLVSDAHVKITDIAGNLVYSTQAEGGQAIWDGKNFSGEKVQTGIYLVFCSNDDGTKKHVTKIMFIN